MHPQNPNPWKVKISVAMAIEECNAIKGLRQHSLDVRCILNQYIFGVALLQVYLPNTKGPAALSCWVRYCWGVIWLRGPLLSLPRLQKLFIWKRKQSWPVALSLPVSLSVHTSVTVVSCVLFSVRLRVRLSLPLAFVFPSLLLSVFSSSLRIVHSSSCPLRPLSLSLSLSWYTHRHTHTPHYSSISLTHLLS